MSPLPSQEHFREMRAARVSGAALDAPQIGPDEDQGIGQSSLEQTNNRGKAIITPGLWNSPVTSLTLIETCAALFMARDITAIGRTLGV